MLSRYRRLYRQLILTIRAKPISKLTRGHSTVRIHFHAYGDDGRCLAQDGSNRRIKMCCAKQKKTWHRKWLICKRCTCRCETIAMNEKCINCHAIPNILLFVTPFVSVTYIQPIAKPTRDIRSFRRPKLHSYRFFFVWQEQKISVLAAIWRCRFSVCVF